MNITFTQIIFLTIITTFVFPCILRAQERQENPAKIGISITPIASNKVGPFGNLVGAGSLTSKKYFAVDVSFEYPLSNRISLQTGLGFSKQQILSESAPQPPFEDIRDTLSLKMLEVPILGSLKFAKIMYVNFGPIIHFDLSKQQEIFDKQNGIGLQLSVGANWNLTPNLSLHLEPGFKSYSLIPFHDGNHPDRILSLGVKVGAKYDLW